MKREKNLKSQLEHFRKKGGYILENKSLCNISLGFNFLRFENMFNWFFKLTLVKCLPPYLQDYAMGVSDLVCFPCRSNQKEVTS